MCLETLCPGTKCQKAISDIYNINSIPLSPPMHNVHFVDFVFLPTEQAATYLKICILTYLLTYINPSSFDWKENTFFLIFVNSKL